MPIDYIVASLPALIFNQPAPISWEKFSERVGKFAAPSAKWNNLETQLRNAMAEARGGEKYLRPAKGCSVYWRNRVLACFQEQDVFKRDELLDKVWWDASDELVEPSAPLGAGALSAYAIKLKIALKRTRISKEKGNEAFDRLTAETKR